MNKDVKNLALKNNYQDLIRNIDNIIEGCYFNEDNSDYNKKE